MDGEEPVVIQEKLNYYIVLQNNHLTFDKIENDIKALLPFHKSLQIAERDENTVAVIIIGLDQSPEDVLNKSGYEVEKIYPVEGV